MVQIPQRNLIAPARVFVATWLVHTADHARRGIDATTDAVVWAGTSVALLATVALTLIFVRHATSATVAAVVFPSIAFGVSTTHLLPRWGALSDPILVDSTTDGWSIIAVLPEIVAALWLGLVAWRVVAANGYVLRSPSAETLPT